MARPIWNGTISFGLLNVPVQLYIARDRRTPVHSPFFHELWYIHTARVCRRKDMRKPKANARSAGVAVLDQRLVAKVKRLSRAKATRKAVQIALEHYAKSRDYSKVLSLYGSGGVASGYDPKTTNPT